MSEYIHGDDLDLAEKEKLIKERDRAEKLHNLKMDLVFFEQWRQDRMKDCNEAISSNLEPEILVEKYMRAINCDHFVNIKGVHFKCIETVVGHEIHRNPEAQAIWGRAVEIEDSEL